MSRDKDVNSKITATPSRRPSINVVDLVAGDGEGGKGREGRKGRRGCKGEGNLSWLEGHFGKVVAISILGKSPDSCSVNARPLFSVKNRTGDEDQRSFALELVYLSSSKAWGAGRGYGIQQFLRFFPTFRKKNQKCLISSLFRVRRRVVGERKEFSTTPSVLRRCTFCLSAKRSASPDHGNPGRLGYLRAFGITYSRSGCYAS